MSAFGAIGLGNKADLVKTFGAQPVSAADNFAAANAARRQQEVDNPGQKASHEREKFHQLGMNVVDFIDDDNSCVAHGVLLVLRGNVPFGNHVAGVSHFVPERHGVSRDKTDHRFFYFQIFVIFGADFFISAAQLSDDDDGIGVRVVHKLFERFDKVNADEHIVAQADDRGLSQPGTVGFNDCFIGKG